MTSESIYKIINDEEFLPLVQKASSGFFKIYNFILSDSRELTKRFYSHLMTEADHFEIFLDDHGARQNMTWVFFAELVASIRNFSIASFQLKHLIDRYPDYNIGEPENENMEFLAESGKTLDFFNESIKSLFKAADVEAQSLGLFTSKDRLSEEEFKEVSAKKHLPYNIEEDRVKYEEERILELSSKFRKVAKIFREENLGKRRGINELMDFIPSRIDEKKAQKIKNIIHSVQSDYDTYVKNTLTEKTDENLKNLRGFISLPLHLLEIIRWLSHFYERHENQIRKGEVKEKIAHIVDKDLLLDRIVNFALFYSDKYLQSGNVIAEKILSSFMKIDQYKLPPPHPLGFHARPATYISLIVNEHGTDTYIVVNGQRFNAKSVLSIMEAGGLIADKGLKSVIFEGDRRVLDDIKILAEHNYCEECDIPRQLNYLRILRNIA
ncbi:MAG: HPr family phosphocarrier protein [Nitrospinota bacterium]